MKFALSLVSALSFDTLPRRGFVLASPTLCSRSWGRLLADPTVTIQKLITFPSTLVRGKGSRPRRTVRLANHPYVVSESLTVLLRRCCL